MFWESTSRIILEGLLEGPRGPYFVFKEDIGT